ncbi:ParB/RepB/Spo0J family partition protein [Pararhodobacter zhoushanensis]|uniref:ParB/RepB/Spo0J family partition protein n=1 Tax=Pararhodobacter zhoushanensis TaxID=2479545 RepID=UPI000F8DF8C3|nr:ParB N-terminal domain-containing protein [Pararhodobacter zhoushanensis]
MDLQHLPRTDILADALLRDRLTCDPEALAALQASIASEGLRQPVEVFPITGDTPWGLLAGHRRLQCLDALNRLTPGSWDTIPCVIRKPADIPQAMALMVSENEMRAQISPWEKGALLCEAVEFGLFDSIEAATDALYPTLTRQARSRLRGFGRVVEVLGDLMTHPHTLSSARMDRLAVAIRAGLGEIMVEALHPVGRASADRQWRALLPAISEAILLPDDPDAAPTSRISRTPRPRRLLRLNRGITLRREWTVSGWTIRIDARHADHPGIVDDILDLVEEWFERRV